MGANDKKEIKKVEDQAPLSHMEIEKEEVNVCEVKMKEPPKAGSLMVVYGPIVGKRAKILLDSGATTTFVSEAFVKLH